MVFDDRLHVRARHVIDPPMNATEKAKEARQALLLWYPLRESLMRIVTLKNATRYCLTTQDRTKWYVYDMLAIPMTVLGLRNLNSYRGSKNATWVLSWKRDANLRRAIELVFLFLKGWQAFRTPFPNNARLRKLKTTLPTILLRFQRQMKKRKVFSIVEVNQRQRALVIRAMVETVHEISKYKTPDNPMLASKIMHFLLPRIFSCLGHVLDTEKMSQSASKKWLLSTDGR
jgi:hypothetical protein